MDPGGHIMYDVYSEPATSHCTLPSAQSFVWLGFIWSSVQHWGQENKLQPITHKDRKPIKGSVLLFSTNRAWFYCCLGGKLHISMFRRRKTWPGSLRILATAAGCPFLLTKCHSQAVLSPLNQLRLPASQSHRSMWKWAAKEQTNVVPSCPPCQQRKTKYVRVSV